MDEDKSRYTGSKGGLLGFVIGLLFALVASFPLLFGWPWGDAHCEPAPQCQYQGHFFFLVAILVVLVIATLLGLHVRRLFIQLVNERLAGGSGRGTLFQLAIPVLIPFLLALMMF
jgi:hypothetical protein